MKRVLFALVVGILTVGQFVMSTVPVQAVSGGDFQAGRIIDDAVFFTPGELTSADIQNFLNSQVPTCDTNGTQTIFDSTYGDTVTRAVYSSRRGYSTPFVCLKDYHDAVPNQPANSACSGSLSANTNESSADIIYNVAHACGINAKVLLVLLQKEQSLVTDTWPWSIQYRSATGYGCPDTAACDSTYYGFYNQVYTAAWQFKKYAQSPTSFNYQAGRTNNIMYSPNAACGSSGVYIQNQATADLYNYTPYQPNAAALSNLYGSGDGCSAYGNRNFWRYYNDWFGSTFSNDLCFLTQETWGSFAQRYVNQRGYHFFTNDTKEQCVASKIVGFGIEPLAGYKVDSAQVANTVPVYKTVNDITGDHFYTISSTERDTAINVVHYRDEHLAYYVYPTQQGSTVPVYRLVNPHSGDHFYTTDPNERDIAKNIVGYIDEGIAFWVNP